jgi:outer membrane protein assembly factor BamA
LEVGIRAGFFNTNVGHGTDSRFPSVEDVYSPLSAPGVNHQPHYKYTGGFAGFDSRDSPLNPRSGGNYQVEGRYYLDHDHGEFSFRHWRVEVQHYFPFFNERRVIAFRGKVELTDTNSDQTVPFYLMPVLGGSEDLRGYREFRFRDLNSAVGNLEYRWEAFSGLDLAVFGDAGDVLPEARDMDLTDFKTSYGFGLRFNTARSVFLRIDFGFGGEGMRTFVKFNHVF